MESRSPRIAVVLLALSVSGTNAARAQGSCSSFPVYDDVGVELSISSAFDGTNFFVAMGGGPTGTWLGCQLVSQTGSLVGPRITAGIESGDAPFVAYGGGQYLFVATYQTIPPAHEIYGQFITPAGVPVLPFLITTNPFYDDPTGLAFDDPNFLVVFFRDDAQNVQHLIGRFVGPGGALVGSELAISSGLGEDLINNVAFGETKFLVVWVDANANSIQGRFVSPGGVLDPEFTIRSAPPTRELAFPTVAFGGGGFLVAWDEEVSAGGPQTDIFARTVSAPNMLGSVISVCTVPNQQKLPFIAFDGTNWLVTWTDLRNDVDLDGVCDVGEGTCTDVVGQRISASGMLDGTEIPIVTEAGDQTTSRVIFPTGQPPPLDGRHLVTWTRGQLWLDPPTTDGVYGRLMGTLGCQEIRPTCFGDGSVTACPCGNNSPPGVGHGCRNSLGVGGALGGNGQASVSADTVVLAGSNMPPGSTALYFQGTAATGVAFGDGLRCAGGAVIRLGTKFNSPGGTSVYPNLGAGDLPISVRGAVPPGGQRFYQGWYRNAANFCTPSTFNLSNGLSIVWVA